MIFDTDVIAVVDLKKDNSSYANFIGKQLTQKQAVIQFGEETACMLIFTKEAKTAVYLLSRSASVIKHKLIKDGFIAI